jgi:hypothetical protein
MKCSQLVTKIFHQKVSSCTIFTQALFTLFNQKKVLLKTRVYIYGNEVPIDKDGHYLSNLNE